MLSRGNLVRIGVIAAIVVGGIIFRDRLTGSATDLRVGDCFDEPKDMTEVSSVQHRPCTEAHDGEIVFVGDYAAQDAYPGQAAFDVFVADRCVPAFEDYVGSDYETDVVYDLGVFFPLEDGWKAGDHEIACYVYRIDGARQTTSVKGAGG